MKKWINQTEKALSGGHSNSLGNTASVAEAVLADDSQEMMQELQNAYGSDDEVVRLRVGSALKRVAGLHSESMSGKNPPRPQWLVDRFDWLVDEVGWKLDQPSARWCIAKILGQIDDDLTNAQRARGIELVQHFLDVDNDWIVLITSAKQLVALANKYGEHGLAEWLRPRLDKMSNDNRKSVASQGVKLSTLLAA